MVETEPWSAIGHRSGGFVPLDVEHDAAPREAEGWRERGAFVEGFRPLKVD